MIAEFGSWLLPNSGCCRMLLVHVLERRVPKRVQVTYIQITKELFQAY